MILVDATIVTVGINTIQHELGGELNQVMWVTSGYLLAYAVPLLITGRLGDLWGVKHTYVAGLVTFVLASLACGLAPSLSMLIIARVVQGLGGRAADAADDGADYADVSAGASWRGDGPVGCGGRNCLADGAAGRWRVD